LGSWNSTIKLHPLNILWKYYSIIIFLLVKEIVGFQLKYYKPVSDCKNTSSKTLLRIILGIKRRRGIFPAGAKG
jgi:hypothetical protein